LALLVSQSDVLEWNKPKEIVSDFSRGGMNKEGKYEIINSRYKTRVKKGEHVSFFPLFNGPDTKGISSVK